MTVDLSLLIVVTVLFVTVHWLLARQLARRERDLAERERTLRNLRRQDGWR